MNEFVATHERIDDVLQRLVMCEKSKDEGLEILSQAIYNQAKDIEALKMCVDVLYDMIKQHQSFGDLCPHTGR